MVAYTKHAQEKEGETMFDRDRFNREVKSNGLRMQTVAEAMGIDRTTLYRKLNGGPDFTLSEIQGCMSVFSSEAVQAIFFAEKVS